MAVFSSSVLDVAQQPLMGTVTADTPAEGRQRLRERGWAILEFQPAAATPKFSWSRLRLPQRRHADQIAELCRYLALLLRASVPLAEALDVLARDRRDRLAIVLKDLRERISGGASLAEAMEFHRDWFSLVVLSAVRVGQISGNLEEALTELAEHLRARQSLRQQLSGALTYPFILCGVGVAVVIFLMSYVIPQLLTVLTASGRPLPMTTRLLKGVSDAVVTWWPLMLAGAVVAAIGMVIVFRSERGARAWHRAQLRLPLVAPLVRKTVVAEFAQVAALLLRTGIPFVDAARTVATVTRNRVLRDELTDVARCVESGSDIAPALKGSRIFPAVVVQLMAVGQDSGELTALLAELKIRYDTEVRLAMQRFTTALEPLLIILLACVVGFVVLACLLPILEATKGMVG